MFFSLPQILGLVPRTPCTPPDSSEGLDGGSAAPVRQVECSRNALQWSQVFDFLEAQRLESLGLRRVSRVAVARQERALAPSCRATACGIPDGNHGDNNLRTVSGVL